MTKRTKTTFGISMLYALFFIAALGIMGFVIYDQGAKREETKLMIAERSAKDASYSNVMHLVESSTEDRAELMTYFITEKDTIGFISELENAAATVGVSLETTELSVTPVVTKDGITTPAVLAVGVAFKGGESAVKKFITLLESVPYRKDIPNFTVTSEVGIGEWSAKTVLRITMKS